MKQQGIMSDVWTRIIVLGFSITALVITGSSVFNIFTVLSGDAIRAALVTLSYGLALIMFTLWTLEAIQSGYKGFAIYTGVIAGVYLVIGFSFLFLNGAVQNNVLDHVDARIKWVMQNVVWIPPTLTGLLTFITVIIQREVAPGMKNSRPLKALEAVNIVLGIVGSMWGTGDAYYGITGDLLGAIWTPFVLDAAILGFVFIALKANDRPTFKFATVLAIVYFSIALVFQLADGALRLQNLDTDPNLKFVAGYLPSVIPLITFSLYVALLIVDKLNGGLSFGPRSMPQALPQRQQMPPRQQTNLPPRPQQPHGIPVQASRENNADAETPFDPNA